MSNRPNILFLMTDQMQGRVLEPDHPCRTPNFDRLAARGVRIERAYTPNAVCSPARASLMTGLLPHNHGVLYVTHTVDDDQGNLRTEYPHWAQGLAEAGYRTGYFGKWHVERTDRLEDFGWQVNGASGTPLYRQKTQDLLGDNPPQPNYTLRGDSDTPPGYRQSIFYGVTDVPPEQRRVGIATSLGLDYLDQVTAGDDPWCCLVSVIEPHDPFITGPDAFAHYDVDDLELPPNFSDDLAGRPGLYRKTAQIWDHWTDRQKREAAICYYAAITEIDQQFGRLIDKVEAAGQLDNTIIILTSDHGELLGAHGLYCKNISAFEEVYHIPMLISGPGVAQGVVSRARVGLHDLHPTLLDLTGCPSIEQVDSRSFAPALRDPVTHDAEFGFGFAEYEGTRINLTQRIVWDGDWKFIFNGFDIDELYNLHDDPHELTNLIDDPAHDTQVRHMLSRMWQTIRDTGDHSLLNSHYPPLRLAKYGPMMG